MSQHLKNFIDSYYYFFDKKLKNTTIIVGLIGILILLVGIFLWGNAEYSELLKTSLKSNVLESSQSVWVQSIKNLETWRWNIIEIAGVQYNIVLSEVE